MSDGWTLTWSDVPPKQIKGRGHSGAGGPTFDRLVAIKAHNDADASDEWYELGYWKHGTACGIARAIARANSEDVRPGDQKCPPGTWEAGVTDTPEGSLVSVRYLGP